MEVEVPPPTPPVTYVRAAILARRFRLDAREVMRILKAFGSGPEAMGMEEFRCAMCRVFDVGEVRKDTLDSAFEAAGCGSGIDVERLLAWYVQNMFTEVNALKASPDQVANDDRVSELAKRHQCRVCTVDRAQFQFQRFDQDRSGDIDFEEFQELVPKLLHTPSSGDVGERRIRTLFGEADTDKNGSVDFPEFTAWYLQYVNPEGPNSNAAKSGAVDAFHGSHYPSIQRRMFEGVQQPQRRRSL
uniref:EF-hand domain-containing protein n=1 Tax=Pyrodinium bahamense TaxID=73915 RepID=A0A7S0FV28_9DINO